MEDYSNSGRSFPIVNSWFCSPATRYPNDEVFNCQRKLLFSFDVGITELFWWCVKLSLSCFKNSFIKRLNKYYSFTKRTHFKCKENVHMILLIERSDKNFFHELNISNKIKQKAKTRLFMGVYWDWCVLFTAWRRDVNCITWYSRKNNLKAK